MRKTPLFPFLLLALVSCAKGGAPVSASTMAKLDTSGFISMTDAVEIAKAEVAGFPVSVELEVEDDDEQEPPAYEVTIFVDGSNEMMSVEVDAVSGDVLEIEAGDDAEDDGQEKDGT